LAELCVDQPIPQLINWLQRWSYDLASLGSGQPLRYNPDRKDALASAAKRMNTLDVLRFHRELVRFQRVVNHPLNPRLLLEDLLLRYAQLVK
jgi:DNA polymerase-3 subunit delta'